MEPLQCRVCRAFETITRRHQEEGWYRCSFCQAANATPAAPHEVYEGPDARTVLLVKPGRLHFIVPAGVLMSRRSFIAFSHFTLTLAAAAIGIFHLLPPGNPVRTLSAPLLGLAAAWVLALLARAWRSEQHLEVGARRAQYHRRAFGMTFRVRALVSNGAPLTAGLHLKPVDPWSSGADRVELSSGDALKLAVICSGAREARWLLGLVEAVLAGQGAMPRCQSCGASLPHDWQDRAKTRVTCAYCQAGYVVDGARVSTAPVSLPSIEAPTAGPSENVTERRAGERLVIRLRAGRSAFRWIIAGWMGAGAVWLFYFIFEMVGTVVRAVWHDGHPFFVVLMALVALLIGYVAWFCAVATINIVAGDSELRFDDGTVEFSYLLAGRRAPAFLQLGGWTQYRRLLTGDAEAQRALNIAAGFSAPHRRKVPLMRLIRVTLDEDAGTTMTVFHTSAVPLVARWDLSPSDSQYVAAQMVAETAARLTRLGRHWDTAAQRPDLCSLEERTSP